MLLVAFSANARDGASGVVNQRMDGMSAMAKAGKSIKKMLKSGQELEPQRVRMLAEEMRDHSERIPALFPDTPHRRGGSQTEALAAIWERREDFEALASELSTAAESPSAAARGGGSTSGFVGSARAA